MSLEATLAKVIEVFTDETGKEILHTTKFKADGEWDVKSFGDSLDFIECVVALEEAFDIEITDEEAEAWTTIADAARTVHAYS